MVDGNWNRDLMEQILALLQLFQEHNVSPDGPGEGEIPALLADRPALRTVYETVRFMDEIPGGFMICRAGGDEEIVHVNTGLLHIYGCADREEFRTLTGGSFRGMVHPDDLEAVEAAIWSQVEASRYDLDYVEFSIIRQDGTIGWMDAYGHFVRGGPAGDFFYVFLGDATEKHARQLGEKERLERRYQGMMAECDRERAMIGQEYLRRLEVIEGLSVTYESILYAELKKNRIVPYRLSVRTRQQFEERFQMKNLDWFLSEYVNVWVHPEDRDMVAQQTSLEYIRSALSTEDTYYFNFRVLCSGELQYMQLRIVNVGKPGRADQIVMGYRRVDEELQREMEQRQVLTNALKTANLAIVAKNEFLSNMSHNMRTPLNAIFGFSALARQNAEDPQAVRGYLERLEASSRQLLALIDEVLEITWIGSQEEMVETECDLCQLVRDACDIHKLQIEEKHLNLTLDFDAITNRIVQGDREKLVRLADYLVGNAVAYTGPGGDVSVTLMEGPSRTRGRKTYRLIVSDTGVGMSREFLDQVFEPFARERNTTISGVYGMGLGLTIAKYIVDQMGGSIQVDSEEGRGSVFTITLQLRTDLDAPAVPVPAAPEHTSGLRILLVEDNWINREIETEILRNGGFVVDTAENGKIGLEKVMASGPDGYALVLMDIQMPVMDGWQAAQAIRKLDDPVLATVPIVALSANAMVEDMRRSMESGMDAHLTKPIDVDRFMDEVRRTVRQHVRES